MKDAIKLIHNRQYIDHYYYFKQNPESMNHHIKSEKNKAQQFFDHPQINPLYKSYMDVSYQRKDTRQEELPEMIDNIEYSTRFASFNTGNDYMIIERTEPNQQKQVVLDLKQLPFLRKYQATLKLTKMTISDDHKMIGFGVDLQNNEDQVWMFKFADESELLNTKLYECFEAKFTKDGKHIVYTEYDNKFRPYKLMMHTIGTSQLEDTTLFEEKDEQFYLDLQQTKDKEYFVLLSQSKQCNEVIIINRDNPTQLQTLFSRNNNAIQYCHHHQDAFYVLTNQKAYDFKVLKQEGNSFVDFYTPANGEVIQDVDLFYQHLVLYITKESDSMIRIIDLSTKAASTLQIPSSLIYTDHTLNKKNYLRQLYDRYILKDKSSVFLNMKVQDEVLAASIQPASNDNYIADSFRFNLSTPLAYNQVYQYNLKSQTLSKLQDSKLTGKPFKREEYTCSKTYAPSKDGTIIPITLVHKKGLNKNRQNKLLLHSYGAYGLAQDVPFNILYLHALERDWIMGFAHIRGGNEMGQAWHKSAIQQHKIKSIDDLIASATHLVSAGYTHPSLLCGLGASAGATILAAAINMRPDLWKCAVLSSPFLDILGSLMDESLPLTQSDYLEFGNPNEQQHFENILGYSPYDNLKQQVYPALYVSAGIDDFRAPLWNVLKYTQKLKDTAKESLKVSQLVESNLIVDIQEGGHFGSAGVQASIEEKARYMAFLEYYVGVGNTEISKENLTQKLDESVMLDKD